MASSAVKAPKTLPDRMRRKGRPENQSFEANEHLFLRFNDSLIDFGEEGEIFFNFRTDQSCNRQSPDGEPGDVLFHPEGRFNNWGVLTFLVSEIRSPMDRSEERDERDRPTKNPNIEFKPLHDPLEDNYYHSTVSSFREGEKEKIKNLTSAMRTWFRTEMAKVLNRDSNVLKPFEAAG